MNNKRLKKLGVLLVVFIFFIQYTQSSMLLVYAMEKNNIKTVIDNTVTKGDSNYFTYYGDGWVSAGSGNNSENYNVLKNGEENPEKKYYTVDFVGNRIEVYGNKTAQNGKAKYSLFDSNGKLVPKSDVVVDARIGKTDPLYAWGGLTEGRYRLKVEATGINSDSKHEQAVLQVDRVEIQHNKYVVESIDLGEDIELIEGAKKQLNPIFSPSYAIADDLKYSSDNEDVATVSDKGLITTISEGTANIQVVSEESNKNDSIAVTVKAGNPAIHGSIVDTNSHYTQDRYDEVMNLGTMSEELYGWKADKAISEIVLASKDGVIKNLTVSSSDFKSESGVISKENIIPTFIKETKAYIGDAGYHNGPNSNPSQTPNDDSLKKSVPDILYTSDPINMDLNSLQSVWIEMNIPKNINPGSYKGTITVSGEGIDNLNFNYTLEVLDATMPDSTDYDFDIELWQYPYSSAEYYGVEPFSKEHFEILTPIMSKYKELGGHAITTSIVEEAWGGQTYSLNKVRYPSMIKWTKKADGTFNFDFTDFDKWVQFNKDLGIGDKIVCYSMIPWGNNVTYYDEASSSTKSETLLPGTDRYEEVWSQFLNKLVAHLDEKAWFDDTYIGIDERGNMDKAFDVIDKVKNRNGNVLKKAAAMDHFSENYKHITDRVDDLSVGSTAAKGSLEAYKNFVNERNESEKDYKTTIYTCTEHFPNSLALSMPGESYWTMMFTAAQGATGYMRWAYDAWVADPLKDTTHWAFEAGDTFLIYPDEKDSKTREVKSSVRLEKMSEGVRDVNKLYLMKKEIPALKVDIDKLFEVVKLNYSGEKNGVGQHGGAKYATNDTKVALPEDMKEIKNEIKNITNKYIQLRENGSNTIESVSINEGNQTLVVGSTLQLTTKVLPENVLNPTVKWASSDSETVSVSNLGVLTANKVGAAKITATSTVDSTRSATIDVVVNNKLIEKEAEVAYYSFDNIDNNLIKNNWGDGTAYNGALTGAEVTQGKSGNALKFTSNNDEIVIEEPAQLEWNWTVAFWVNRGNSTGTSSVMWDGRQYSGAQQQNSESIDLAVGVGANAQNSGVHVNSGTLSFKYIVPNNQWVHMAITNSKENGLSLFVNGSQVGDTNAYTKNNLMKAPLKIIGGRGFIGELDEVKVYNRALTQSEINQIKAINGLNIDSKYKEINVGEKTKIITNLVSNNNDKTVKFTSLDTNVAKVEEDGTVTGVGYGDTIIKVENEAAGYLEEVKIRVNKPINLKNTLDTYEIDPSKQIVIDREDGVYLGQPDSILLDDDKTILTVYPNGHGFGEALLSKSTDGGLTWEKRVPANETWKNSEETPTIYKLDLIDGTQKLISISGGPAWHGSTFRGFKTSISDDNGETWSEYKEWETGINTIVGMASLIQLKDEDGNLINKWMGVFHDYSYINYKTYLTFDDNGKEQWSTPEPYLSEYRDVESEAQICEVGMFRSPDGNRIVALARSQSHKHTSTIFYSDDEGKTWSRPRYVQGSLNGERHKATYDPISGRLLISFREIKLDTNDDGSTSDNDWMAGDWIGWVGTYDDLMNGNEGEYRICLGKDYTKSARAGDCGYAGNVVMSDGTFFLNSYGNFDTNTNNNTYIMGVRFKLGEIDNALGLVNRNELDKLLKEVEKIDSSLYTEESYSNLIDKYKISKSIFDSNESSQVEIDEVKESLSEAIEKLVKKDDSVSKKHLEIAVSEAMKVTEEELLNVIPMVVDEFKATLKEAEIVLESETATQEEIDKAFNDLGKVMKMLSLKKGDKSALKELIEKVNLLDEKEYLEEEWNKLQIELDKANKVNDNENAREVEVAEAYDNLAKALLNLRVKPSKEKLEEVINKIEKLNPNDYTEESWNELQEQLKFSIAVNDNEKATEEEINKSVEGLELALNNLTKKNNLDDDASNDKNTSTDSSSSKVENLPGTGDNLGGIYILGNALSLVVGAICKKRV